MPIGHLILPTKHAIWTLGHCRPHCSRMGGLPLLLPVSEKPEVVF